MVCALGAASELVAVSHECDYPDEIRHLPALTRARLQAPASSAAIDRAVRSVLEDALSLYTVDHERLAALEPDLILTQDLCQVCAVSLDDVKSALARMAGRDDVRILSLRPTRLSHVLGDLERVGAALGRQETATNVRAALERRLAAVSERASQASLRPRVASIEWLEPLMLGGTWMPDLIELAGGTAVGVSAGAPAPTLEPEQLAELEPAIVLFKPCGFSLERTLRERPLLERVLPPAVRASARAYVSDGNAYFNRSGPRLVESLEILAACIHPELFADFSAKHAASLQRLH
jgi:iron complex transport system substrate-binding protein